MGLEGIVSKMAAEPYASGRSQTWIKAKCVLREEFAVAGYTISSVSKSAIGSLVLACHDGGKLVPAGRVGTGFSDAMARALKAELERNRIMNPPFGARLDQKALSGVQWVKSSLVVEIEHRGWTADGLLRQASFKGIREDKDLGDVQVEKPSIEKTKTDRQAMEEVELTHPDRLLWPDVGITKQGLAEFYEGIADWILPHVKDRVLSTVRCPGGAGPSCFYAKHLWKGAERSLKPIDLGEAEPMFYISDMRGLLALVQSNVLEIHPWGSRIGNVEKPDRIIFDLDPGGGVNCIDVIAASIEVRTRLRDAGLESFVKTSGGKGLHVVAPIRPKLDWDSVKAFSKTIAAAMAADTPQKFLAVATKSRRKGRIFVDYLRNARGATAVAAYSARARPGAPVSVPLTWSELDTGVGPDWFRIDNLRQRLDFLRDDPWAGFFDNRQELRIKAK
jgi:bifunctional non-homologous end joining protein LigD